MDPTLILLVLLLGVMIVFMVRNSRKRAKDAEDMKTKLVPGVELMTGSGLFGTVVSIDDDENKIIIESTPGTLLTIHRQAIARLIDPSENVVGDDDSVEPAVASAPLVAGEPDFGRRDAAHTTEASGSHPVDPLDPSRRDSKND